MRNVRGEAEVGIRTRRWGCGDQGEVKATTNPHERSRDPAAALVRLGAKSFPLLIDCLIEGRLASIEFAGSTTSETDEDAGGICLPRDSHGDNEKPSSLRSWVC